MSPRPWRKREAAPALSSDYMARDPNGRRPAASHGHGHGLCRRPQAAQSELRLRDSVGKFELQEATRREPTVAAETLRYRDQ